MPTRFSGRAAVAVLSWALPLILLGGCAHSPRKADAPNASAAVPAAPAPTTAPGLTPGGAAMAQNAAAAGSDTPAVATAPGGAAAGTAAADTAAGAPAPAADAALPGPPADSVVTVKPTDLLDRLRSGFQLQDVDEPAVDSQLNWFANHPEFLERTFGRAELWLYYIIGELEKRKMPTELALLPVIESAFEPYAYSRARAAGLWQFISDTGRRFDLKQDWWYDGRRDPIEATRAALDYLQALHDQFNGDWLLAVAAYNCGELTVSRAIERNQRLGRPTDFWHLKLPTETRGYVPELLAMRRLVADPAKFGVEFSHIPNEPYFVSIDTGGQIDLQVVADIANVSVDDLYELNPGFHRWATDPTGPNRLLVPADAAAGLEQAIAQLSPDQRMRVAHYAVRRGDTLARIARRFKTRPEVIRELNELGTSELPVIATELRVPSPDIQLPLKAMHAAMLVDAPPRLRHRRGTRPVIHVVRRGDTLYSLAQRMHTDVQTLAQINGLTPDAPLRAGQHLRLAPSRDTLAGLPSRHRTHRGSLLASADAGGAGDADHGAGNGRRLTYVVRPGDTLYGIARQLQVRLRDLLAWNGLSHHEIHPGQTLVAFVKADAGG